MRMSIIVPSAKAPTETCAVLRSLLRVRDPRGGTEIIWVSPHEPHACARDGGPSRAVHWIRTDEVLSAARARNLGLRHARGDLVAFVDDDVLVCEGFVEEHLAAHEEARVPVLVRGNRWEVRERHLAELRGFDGVLDRCRLEAASYLTRFERAALKVLSDERRWSFRINWMYGITANLSIPRACLPEGPLFDERFGAAACEDTEMVYRLFARGLRMRIAPAAPAFHVHGPPSLRTAPHRLAENVRLFRDLYPDAPDVRRVTKLMLDAAENGRAGSLLHDEPDAP